MTRFLGIVSGKGGVGKTTAAINLCAALSNFGKDVLVVDGNVRTPNIGLNLGNSKFPLTIHSALKGKNTLQDSVHIHSSGLKFIPGSISFEEAQSTKVDNLPKIMLDLYGVTDLVLIDGPSGLGRDTNNVIESSDEIIIVVNQTIASVTDAIKTAKLAREKNIDVYGIIINKINQNDEVSSRNISTLIDAPVIGEVPEDVNLKEALSLKHPVVFSHPDSESSIAYKKIAASMLGQEYEPKMDVKRGFFSRLFS